MTMKKHPQLITENILRPDLRWKKKDATPAPPPRISHASRRSITIVPGPKFTIPGAKPRLAEPTVAEMAENFAGAMERWAKAGFRTVTKEQYAERSAICDSCEFWDGKARLGLGKCKAPGCGCTSLKRWLVSERCTHPAGSRWPTIQPPASAAAQ